MNRPFSQKLKEGKAAENAIERWLRASGFWTLTALQGNVRGKGPRMISPDGTALIGPDFLVFGKGQAVWVKVKLKGGFTFHRQSGWFETGVDAAHFADYQRVAAETPFPVWIFYLVAGEQVVNSPPSESGLFANPVRYLEGCISHTDNRRGTGGMIYWRKNDHQKLATYDDIVDCVPNPSFQFWDPPPRKNKTIQAVRGLWKGTIPR